VVPVTEPPDSVTKLQVVLEDHTMRFGILAKVKYQRDLEIRCCQEREGL